MNESLEVFLKTIPIITLFLPLLRFFIIMQNRTVVEYIILPHRTREWENFLEVVFLCFIMVLACTLPIFIVTIHIKEQLFIYLFITNCILILGAHIFIIVCWLILWFTNRIKKYSNFIKKYSDFISIVIFVDFLLHLTLLTLFTILFKDMITKNFLGGKYINIYILVLVIIFLVIFLFYVFRDIARYFVKKNMRGYKLEIVDDKSINELYFVYSIDNDIQVFQSKAVNKKQLELPAYIFYPKEKLLYKIYQEYEK